ncbi:MAG: endolytic transglycosylase MltG [Bacteroidales bacterium]|nr:endolytic transglycosylase MltG [Bacteroidales bacterium]MBQ2598058.1 endolytic transglycosylase MltG [Bacteroidales bacterium]
MKKKSRILLFVLLALAVIGAGAAYLFYKTFYQPNVAAVEKPQDIRIYRSFDSAQMLEAVLQSGMIDNEKTFLRAAKAMKLQEHFRPGLYRFKKGMGNKALVRSLQKGWQQPVRLTIPGYFRSLDRFADFLDEQLEASREAFAATLADSSLAARYGFSPESFIGMFIPNTYEVWWTVTPEDLVERMHQEYEKFWTAERDAKALAIGLTRQEVSTLASIVIEESKYEPELPRIAGVYMNRLQKDMLLQADPTVLYAVGDPSIKRVLNRHLETDSPYNTYKYAGLPPGPITMPPVAAIDAVLNYERHDYLYFCAKDSFDGQHAFAKTLSAHNENARRYQQALSRQMKAAVTAP